MATIYDVDATELIEQVAEELKKIPEITPPVWAIYVKTGRHRERPPIKPNWWYIRSASVLRKIYRLGPIGVSKLRRYYGGKPNRGFKKKHFYKGSGSIIRKILQQLEKAGFLKKESKKFHKGRSITPQGRSFLDKIANRIAKGRTAQKAEAIKVEIKKEKKELKEAVVKEEKKKEGKKEEARSRKSKKTVAENIEKQNIEKQKKVEEGKS